MRVATGRRVVITGMGLISPLGNSPEALWEALLAGQSGVRTDRQYRPPTEGLPISMAARPGTSLDRSTTWAAAEGSREGDPQGT